MSFINLNRIHVIKVLTLALAMSLGSLHPSCALDELDSQLDQFQEKRINQLIAENNLKIKQMVETTLLEDINELKSSYSLSDSAATPLLLAAGGTAFFFYSGNSLLTSFALSAGYATYRFLISQYHHYRILHSLKTALTSTREEKIQLELKIESLNAAK